MSMPTAGKPDDCVNFGDASVVGDVSVAAWVARKHKDPIAQYVATSVGEIRTFYALVWYDPSVEAKKPGSEFFDVRFTNDIVVSRTGWGEKDSVLALRSGGPANHEHADRNSIVFKAFGERLLHDPFKAAYPNTLQHWILRLTAAHTAILINGKGHQYHDGKEGTNASWAEAAVVRYQPSARQLIVTSDATEAYRLVNPDVKLVRRTLVFLKPDIVVVFDRVKMGLSKATVQLRFQVYNGDEKGEASVGDMWFLVKRPLATLKGTMIAPEPLTLKTGLHAVPKEIGTYPFVEAEGGESSDHQIVSVFTAQQTGREHGTVSATMNGAVWNMNIDHNGQRKTVRVNVNEELPTIEVA
jgi:hypothetical protein